MKLALDLYRRLRPDPSLKAAARADGGTPPSGPAARGGIAKLRWVWALVLALEKRSKMRSVVKARNRGMAVVCDRYPQVQVTGFNDGPLLAGWIDSAWSWRRWLSRWELEVYRSAARNAPDLAIKLKVSPDVAGRRKPEVTAAEVSRRLGALARIEYGERCDHLVLDADRPLEQILADVKRAIWERL